VRSPDWESRGQGGKKRTMSQPSTVDSGHAVHLGQDDGEAFRLGPLEIIVKENGSGTRMNLAVAEFRGNNFRIPPHIHTEHDETIYVLEGRMEVELGKRTFTAAAGSSFTIPIHVPHAIWNESGVRVRFLNVIVAARYLDYFREMAAAAGTSLPPMEVIARVMGRYGLQPVKH
jgi:quercetin dioxygenase-like cupin family protein